VDLEDDLGRVRGGSAGIGIDHRREAVILEPGAAPASLTDAAPRDDPLGGGDPMATPRLRIFPRPQDEPEVDPTSPGIPIRLSDLYPLLAQAYRDNFVWLRDFEEDELLVSNDLFEVVRAFSDYRPSA
jgi:hypothetical protein